jgi:shikimate kinase/3-dehydroquinate synthase
LTRAIVLIGYMGAGKTTVGRFLAQTLRRPLVDLDEALEAREGLSIPEIFAQKGEGYFRDLETRILREYAHGPEPRILAAGGGAVVREENRAILNQTQAYYLKAPPEVLWARLHGPERAHRPLAQSQADFLARFGQRKPLYESVGQPISALEAPIGVAERIALDFLAAEDFSLTVEGRQSRIRTLALKSAIYPRLRALAQGHKTFVLLDRAFLNEAPLFKALLPEAVVYCPKAKGEAAKTLAEAEAILTLMAENRLDRSDCLLAKGGGALTDLGGFCAGLYKRGLNLILWPTTLLGAVDAAIGGKTAVNLLGVKNQVGLFYAPNETWLEPGTIANCPAPLLAEGLVEALKTGLLFDPELAWLVENNLAWLLRGDLPLVLEVARRSAQAKARLVEKDFREEKGLRDVLNLGHTYGHVAESFHGPALSHGRAVALGLAVALEVSLSYGFDPHLAARLQKLCLSLAGEFPDPVPAAEARRLLAFDKKIRAGRLKFVVLKAPGEPEVLTDFEPERALAAAEALALRLS